MVNNIRPNMKIVVIGGSGLIGSKLITKLGQHGHQAVAASPSSGVNTLTGEGLAGVLGVRRASVTEVCFEVGCTSLGTFSTRFTELVGMPPSAYRRVEAGATELVA